MAVIVTLFVATVACRWSGPIGVVAVALDRIVVSDLTTVIQPL